MYLERCSTNSVSPMKTGLRITNSDRYINLINDNYISASPGCRRQQEREDSVKSQTKFLFYDAQGLEERMNKHSILIWNLDIIPFTRVLRTLL